MVGDTRIELVTSSVSSVRWVVCCSGSRRLTWSDASLRVWVSARASAVVVTHFVTRRHATDSACRREEGSAGARGPASLLIQSREGRTAALPVATTGADFRK